MTLVKAIWFYHKEGYTVIPFDTVNKKQIVKWTEFQSRFPQDEEIEQWITEGKFDKGFAIVCGKTSNNFCALDLDKESLVEELNIDIDELVRKDFWVDKTKKGYHIMWRVNDTVPSGWKLKEQGFELLAQGQLCFPAPTHDKTTIGFESIYDRKPLVISNIFHEQAEKMKKQLLKTKIGKAKKNGKDTPTGERNTTLFKLIRGYDKRGISENEALILANDWNSENKTPLPEKEVLETLKSVYRKLYFQDKKFMASILGTEILKKENFKVTTDNQEIWIWNKHYYEPNGIVAIKKHVQNILTTKTSKHYKNEVISWIEDEESIHKKREEIDNYPELLNLENGILNIKTKALIPHSPKYFFTSMLPIRYDAKAKIKLIQEFWEDLLPLDYITIVQEFFGDCLQPTYKWKKSMIAVGEKNTGKSKALELLEIFLGKENVSDVDLYSICNDRFSVQHLHGKKANICSQIESAGIRYTGMFLMLTGNDRIYAQKKGKDGFFFRNFAKLIFSCNKIPDIKNKGDEWYIRWLPIPFTNVFTNETRNVNIIRDITTDEEMSGLLNWAIEGGERLEKHRGYSEFMTLEKIKDFMDRGLNPIKEFTEKYITADSTEEYKKDKIYQCYRDFCKKEKYPILASQVFSKKFKDFAPETMEGGQGRILKGRTWKGIKCTYCIEGEKEEVQAKIEDLK